MAGTRQGITALQMDIKISGITPAILEEALAQAKVARFEILDVIESAIAEHVQNWHQQHLRLTVFRFLLTRSRLSSVRWRNY